MVTGHSTTLAIEPWLTVTYRPTSLFSLRMTHATSKGGKTLLVPTPYAFKVALIDACFRMFATSEAPGRARQVFDLVKGRAVRFRPPRYCVVQNTFIKIKQEERGSPKGIYASTIAYREYVHYEGLLEVAVSVAGIEDEQVQTIAALATRINYLGKRGSFLQFIGFEVRHDPLPRGFTCPESEADLVNGGYGATHYLDEFGQALVDDTDGFERVNSYGSKPSALGKYRVLVPTMLPYRYRTSSRHFTCFELID